MTSKIYTTNMESAVASQVEVVMAGTMRPRVDVLPYEPREEKQRAFVVNLFRYVWLVGIVMIAVPVVLLAWRRWRRMRRSRSPNLCAACGYDLRHVGACGCPECGEGRED